MDDFAKTLQAALTPAYTLETELTGGGMSRVFVAHDVALGRKVVVKVLPPELAAGVNHERFRREIQVAAQLQHPHIVPLLSAGEQGSLIWYTMPFIAGHSLREAIGRGDRFAIKDVIRILRDVAEALEYAHGLGVIHRDIKPGNVLLMGSHALVTDFGVAKAISASMPASGYTSAGMAIGTPAYMAPEQIAADPAADHRMDLYALGLLSYEMLTGKVPFKESSPQQTMAAQLTRDPEPVEQSRPDVPPMLSALVKKLLAKLPDERPARAADVVASLDDIALSSGSTLAPLKATRRASAARAVFVSAAGVAIVAAAWFMGQRTGEAAGTSFLRDSLIAAETTQAVAPAATLLTREDSIAIANAVSSRIAAAPPRRTSGASRPNDSAAAFAFADSMRQFVQRLMLDSMLKVEARRVELEAANVPDASVAVEQAAAMAAMAREMAIPQEPKRVVIALPRPARGRPELDAMANVMADSLRDLLGRDARYKLVPADSVAMVLRESRTVNAVQEKLDADLIVSVALVPVRDSVVTRMIQLRDLRQGGGWGMRVVTGVGHIGQSPAEGVSEMMPKVTHQLKSLEAQPLQARPPRVPTEPRPTRP